MQKLGTTAALLLAMIAIPAGGCSSDGGDDAAKFAGTWTFDSGMVMPMCALLPLADFSLVGLEVIITATDKSHLAVTAGNAGCAVNFTVSGATATASPGQACTLEVAGGPRMIGVTSWTMTIAGDIIQTQLTGTLEGLCMPSGLGVLGRHAADGGAADAGAD